GVFTWTPTLAQGPSTNLISIRATDNGSPPASSAQTVTITVNEVNTAPVLTAIGSKTVNEGTLLTFQAVATDADVPAQALTYSLDSGAPTGASINPSTGVFSWTPTKAQGRSEERRVVKETDSGTPPLRDIQNGTVAVT